MDQPLLTIDEVAALFAVSKSTIYRRVRNGEFPKPIKFGSLTRFQQSDVDQIVATLSSSVKTGSEQ